MVTAAAVVLAAAWILIQAIPSGNRPPGTSITSTTPGGSSATGSGNIQWDGLKHDSFDAYYRSPFGAVPAGTPVTLRFRTIPLDVSGVDVIVYRYDPATSATGAATAYPMTYLEDRAEAGRTYAEWTATIPTSRPALLYYKFKVTSGADVDWYADAYADDHDNVDQGGLGAPTDDEPATSFQITAYDPNFRTPDWLQNASVYQIFPDRFRNGDPTNDYCRPASTTDCPTFYGTHKPIAHDTWNSAIDDPRQPGPFFDQFGTQFWGGDLDGITSKLDYIHGLGFDTIYLTPIFLASSNHRYDTADYHVVDPALGGNPAYARLIAGLKARGMHLILDGVFNHTSSDSVYFNRYGRFPGVGACQSLTSPYRGWYDWINDTIPCDSTSYTGWFGYDSLAVLKDDSPAVRNFFYRAPDSVVAQWYAGGASGWRFDVADEISHNWWRDLRPMAKGLAPQGPLIGEVWADASTYLLGDQLDSVMNYRFRKSVLGFARGAGIGWRDNDNHGANEIQGLTPSQLDHALRAIREDYPTPATNAMLNLIGSHDTNRALYLLTEIGDAGLTQAKARLRLAALLQFANPGAPMVYYGDEAGINAPSLANGTNGPEDDPYNRAPYPWADASGSPSIYGPADPALIGYYSRLGQVRRDHPALRTGGFQTLLTGDTTASPNDDGVYAYARTGPQAGGAAANRSAGSSAGAATGPSTGARETCIVLANNAQTSGEAVVPVPQGVPDGTTFHDALTGTAYGVSAGTVTVSLPAFGGAILVSS